MVRRALLIAAAVIALPSPAAAHACAGSDDEVTAATTAAAAAAVRCLVDAERTSRGLGALGPDAALDRAAQGHAQDMLDNDYFSHQSRDGRSPGDRIAAQGYRFWAWGENIAYGQETPREVVTAWMRSDGHCRNVLAGGFTELGLGIAVGRREMWVQNFGREEGVEPSDGIDVDAACPATGLVPEGSAPAAPPAARPAAAPPAAPAPAASPAPAPAPAATFLRVRMATRMVRGRLRIEGRVSPAGDVRRLRLHVRRGRATRRVTVRVRSSGRFAVVTRAPRGRGSIRVTAHALD